MKINLKKSIDDHIHGGLADNLTTKDIARTHKAPIELIDLMLQWGVDVEMEHTDDPNIAREIAMDHLMEDPVYYKKLKEMEG